LKCTRLNVPTRLPFNIEFALRARIVSNARDIQPVAGIAAWIKINEPMLKPGRASSPV
jgi:hypothetical protein